MTDNEFETPAATDFHGNKRELLRKGKEAGFLDWKTIYEALPPEHLSATEQQVFIFTCKSIGIELRGEPRRP